MAGAEPTLSMGEELDEISPEIIGFTPLSAGKEGAKKLKLLPSPWPTDNVPPASATLLSVASKRRLLAAASPDKLVVTSTEKVRKAFQETAAENDIVADFTPDIVFDVPQLRHVAFSADEDFLVASSEKKGGLVVYGVDDLLKGNTQPGNQISTNNTAIRALLPNPTPEQAHYMAVILETGRLDITDVVSGNTKSVHDSGVKCASWSLKGKAILAGFEDGTAAIHLVSALDQVKGKVPRPPELGDDYTVSAVNWLSNEDFLLVYTTAELTEEVFYYFVSTNKVYSNFTFRKTPYDVIFASPDCPSRPPPPRFSIQRLRRWDQTLDDFLIVTAAHSADVGILLKSTEPLDSAVPKANEYQMAALLDNRKASVPRNPTGDADTALIGEAMDLSSKEKVPQPSCRLEEIAESPEPLPAYYLLTHEGTLAAWWVVWDKSLESGTAYPGLTSISSDAPSVPAGNLGFGKPAFGSPSAPAGSAFGKPAFGTSSAPGSLSFGKPSTPSAIPASGATGGAAFGTPAFGAKPAFGAASQVGGKPSLFGAPAQMSPKPSPFGSGGSTTQPNPFAAGGSAFQKPNPFAAAAANSKSGGGSSGGSPFSSFASTNDNKSGFGALGGKPLSSFGSTVTVDSKASGIGSTLPSLSNTPGQQSSSLFGGGEKSSFQSFTSTQSGSTDVGDRGRDEATPTPQNPLNKLKEVTGVFDGKFKLGSTFKGDGSAKDDLPKPDMSSADSLFSTGFSSALGGIGGASKPPETPVNENKGPFFSSTTPATAPRGLNGLFSGAGTESTTPKPPPQNKIEPVPEEAPLPPDWRPTKPSKTDDEIPPLAGSPPIKIEAPSSSADELPLSPSEDDEEGDLSNPEEQEEEEGEDEGDELSEGEDQTGDEDASEQSSPAAESGRRSQQSNMGPRNYPAAPTPPHVTQLNARPPHNRSSVSNPLFGGTRRDPPSSSLPPAKPPAPQPVFSDLIDDEDERIRQELESEVEPSRTLAPFIAKQEYAAPVANKTGHAAQIEIVYRDINSMVDTLSLNSRSLKAFVEWHERSERYTELGRDALEEVLDEDIDGAWFDKWSLCEINDLMKLEDELDRELDEGAVKSVVKKLLECVRIIEADAKLHTRLNVERRTMVEAKDPEKMDALRKAALPKELADQQKALRREYAQLLTQLAKAEEELILLRSRLVSLHAQNGRMGDMPSVERIKKTIQTLVDLTKERNNEIAVKESRLQKALAAAAAAAATRPASEVGLSLRQSTATTTPRRGAKSRLALSRNGGGETPFATPPTSRSKMSLSELNSVALTPEQHETPSRGYGLFYTPRGSTEEAAGSNMASLADVVDDDLERLRESAGKRRGMVRKLAGALAERGVKRTVVKWS
ncbi:hypothetical protein BU23DRAFT_527561 [Bimuria novae-zelandiae CBS 107.79]|uniref:Nucleoporin Nup159/Nup146 N-terminal domain-containing protein n=1 Tax=Bimuria novae-zelandiae CBS 107.79 TaxID=1447943 RepID=A0A6A5VL31_9PLEO|nr:hypothetical protein BU23DRAFT_527561 [Bimuria novae-zelandiae CBS 107.79]